MTVILCNLYYQYENTVFGLSCISWNVMYVLLPFVQLIYYSYPVQNCLEHHLSYDQQGVRVYIIW
jgi:hypothetical protein